jgi:hypothetical protein
MENFNLKNFLVENKLTINSRLLVESRAGEYLKRVHQHLYDSDPELLPNPVDVMYYIGEVETQEVPEEDVYQMVEEKGFQIKNVAIFQFEEERYDFDKAQGAGEFDGAIVIQGIFDKAGNLVPYKGYTYLGTTDTGSLTGDLVLLNKEHVEVLKSMSDIFDPN